MVAYKPGKKLIGILLVWCITSTLFAQSPSQLEQKVTLAQRSIRLDSLLQTVTRQTGIKFSYNSRRLNTAYRLRLPATIQTVKQVLEELKKSTGVLYTLIENHVILNIEKSTIQKPVSDPKPVKTTQPDRSITPAAKPVPDTLLGYKPIEPADSVSVAAATPPGITDPVVTPVDTLVTEQKLVAAAPAKTDSITSPGLTIIQPVVINKSKLPAKPVRTYFIDLGVSAEETLFMGATVQGGLPKIFGLVSVKSTGSSVMLLYGLGTSMNVKKKSRILLTVQVSPYTKNFTHRVANELDTTFTVERITVKGALARFSAGLEWKSTPNSNWKFYAGLNFNALQSWYRVNGKSSGLGSLDVADAEKKFAVIYPFYTLTNTYQSDLFVTIKTWIGLELGIRYTINFK
jgi:hypothetical protein